MSIYVTCVDGKRRHSQPFEHKEQAMQWAEWGHFCVSEHTYSTDDPVYDELPTEEEIEEASLNEPIEIGVDYDPYL